MNRIDLILDRKVILNLDLEIYILVIGKKNSMEWKYGKCVFNLNKNSWKKNFKVYVCN